MTRPGGSIAEFLLARIAEDEAVVKAEPRWLDPGTELQIQFGDFGDDERFMVEIGARRVLAECDAKRRIVQWHPLVTGTDRRGNPVHGCGNCIAAEDGLTLTVAGPCMTLRLLALPYADHDDYRGEWKP